MAQTLTAGVLEKAALFKSILVHIRGRDCVAIETRYRKKCYQAYTKCVTRKEKGAPTVPTLYDKAFGQFCVQTIEKRIIENKEVFFLGQLLNEFIKCVQAIDHVHVTYQAARLKKRIQKRYSDIVFHRSKTARKGTLVYIDSVTAGDVADGLTDPSSEGDTSDVDGDEEDYRPPKSITATPIFSIRELFFAAMDVKRLLSESEGIDVE